MKRAFTSGVDAMADWSREHSRLLMEALAERHGPLTDKVRELYNNDREECDASSGMIRMITHLQAALLEMSRVKREATEWGIYAEAMREPINSHAAAAAAATKDQRGGRFNGPSFVAKPPAKKRCERCRLLPEAVG